MQVKCKKNRLKYDTQPHYFRELTIGKSYELLNKSNDPKFRVYGARFLATNLDLKTLFYEIVDNSGLSGYYPSQLFYSLDEIRDIKINQILTEKNFSNP
jgi:hypothetical protein